MTNKEAAKVLRKAFDLRYLDRPENQAIKLAIAALEDPLLDRKKAAALGGRARAAKYKPRDFRKWGKMGGRPKNKAA